MLHYFCFGENTSFIVAFLYLLSNTFQNKLKGLASKGTASLIADDTLKGQDSVAANTRQSVQPEETSRGAEQAERENDLPQQADDLSTSLDELSIPSSPEALDVRPHGDYNLVNSLLNLTKSPVSDCLDRMNVLNSVSEQFY